MQRSTLVGHLTICFMVDMVELVRADAPVLDALLRATIAQANVAAITRQNRLQAAYAGVDDAPPDALRRPISINALASSLRLPYETVRRRVKIMADRGLCEQRERGMVIPSAACATPEHLRNISVAYERLQALYYELRARGLIGDLPRPAVALEARSLPVRAVARLVNDYVLRGIEVMRRTLHDPLDVLIVLQVYRWNTAELSPDCLADECLGGEDVVPACRRKPLPVVALARRLGLPRETVRRHAQALVGRGILDQGLGGVILPARTLALPEVASGLNENLANVQRLFRSLAQLGVLAIWERTMRGPPKGRGRPVLTPRATPTP